MTATKKSFGITPDGAEVKIFTLENDKFSVSIMELGATVVNLLVPDKNGKKDDVALGFDNLDGYLNLSDYQGALAGPVANRIGGGRFSIDGIEYNVTKNENSVNCLHSCGEFTFAVWHGEILCDNAVSFTYVSPDMKNGFPGNINATVTYSVENETELRIDYSLVSDRKTVINPTNHLYFNLSGYAGGTILDHEIKINADFYTPVDKNSIPTGEIAPVKGTPFAFTGYKKIGAEIDSDCEQLKNTGGYDHNFCINGFDSHTLNTAAVVVEPLSGRRLTVKTDLPGVQFYAGNFLKGVNGKSGKPMNFRTGFCLETQYYPDTPNHGNFPNCVFDAEEKYSSVTVYAFDCI